jgi:hypothetical protein
MTEQNKNPEQKEQPMTNEEIKEFNKKLSKIPMAVNPFPSLAEATGLDQQKEPEITSSNPPQISMEQPMNIPPTEDELVQQARVEHLNEIPEIKQNLAQDKVSLQGVSPTTIVIDDLTSEGVTTSGAYQKMKEEIAQQDSEKFKKEYQTEPIIPVSKTENLPVIETSSPEHVDQTVPQKECEKEPITLRRIREYILSEQFNVRSVYIHLAQVSSNDCVVPRISLWQKPREMEKVAEIVHRIVTTPGFLENAYPSLCIVMGNSIDNEVWSARILTTIALFEAIKVLPFVEE